MRPESRLRPCARFDAPEGAWYEILVRSSVALGCAVPFAAASLACGITADYSGLQGGARGGLDAGSATDAAEPIDVVADATSPSPSDAGEAGRPFCASLATPVKLCADFDEGGPVDAGWGATDVYGGAAISVGTNAYSLPGAFLSAINPGGAPSSARLLQAVPTQSPHVHVEVEMLLVPGSGTFELAVIHEVTADGTTYGLYCREVGGALQVQLRSLAGDGSVFDQVWPIGAPPTGWFRIDLDMDVSDTGAFTVQQEGKVVVSQTDVPTSTPSRTAMFVELGFYSFAPASGQASFDNAIVDWP